MARESRILTIPDGLDNERADSAIARMTGLSRSIVEQLMDAGEIQRKSKPLGKSDRVKMDDVIEIVMPAPRVAESLQATPVKDFVVVYNDEDLIVIDKPVGVAAHPSPGWQGATVIGAIIAAGYEVATSGAQERQGIVHRLDVGTSGLMVVAKNENSYASLKDQFRRRSVHKVYHAMAQGHMDPPEGTIDAPIDRHPREDYRFAVVAGGKPSVTHYRLLELFPSLSLLEIELETGRTHQIRVHLAALRHPLLGDLVYGADPTLAQRHEIHRPWLHARLLAFTHPRTGREISFTSDYPQDLAECLAFLRANNPR